MPRLLLVALALYFLLMTPGTDSSGCRDLVVSYRKDADLCRMTSVLLVFGVFVFCFVLFSFWHFLHHWVGKIPWRRKWQPTPVLLPGKFHGWRSLVGYSPWGRKESDTTEQLHSIPTNVMVWAPTGTPALRTALLAVRRAPCSLTSPPLIGKIISHPPCFPILSAALPQ